MFDIRTPIGIMFLILGAILMLYGLTSGPEVYRAHSLGVNLNLIWGAPMALFGAAMLALTRLKGR